MSTCEREGWCDAAATRTYVRSDFPHYDPGDERADVPFETVRTCDQHPMGDGQDGTPDYGWKRASEPQRAAARRPGRHGTIATRKREVTAVASLVKTVEMRILANAGDAQARLDDIAAKADKLDGDSIKMRFRLDDAEGKAQLDGIRAQADRLGFKDIAIKVRVDGAGKAIGELAAVRAEADKARGGGMFSKLGGIIGGIGVPQGAPLIGGLSAAGPAGLGILAGGLAALLPEIVAVVNGFTAATAGAGAFAALAYPAVKKVATSYQGLSAAQQAYGAAQAKYAEDPTKSNALALKNAALNVDLARDAIGKLPAAEQSAIRGISSLVAEFGKLSRAFQPQAFKIFADGLKVVNSLMPALAPMANAFANALHPLLGQLNSFVTSTGFQGWLKQFTSLIGPAVTAIGQGIGGVAIQAGKLLTVFSGADIARGIGIAFDVIKGAIAGVRIAIQGLKTAWDTLSQNATFKKLASDFSQAWDSIAKTAGKKPDFSALTTAVKNAVSTAAGFVRTQAGPLIDSALNAASKWLAANAKTILLPVGKAVMQGLIDGIRSQLPSLGSILHGAANLIEGAFKHGMIMFSPSRRMLGLGQQTMAGLIAGIQSSLPALALMAKKAAATILAEVKAEAAYAKSVAASAVTGLSLTSINLTTDTVTSGMQTYLATLKSFTADIKALSAQHLNKSVLQQLIAAGPATGDTYAQSILQSGSTGQVNALYKQISAQAAQLGAQAAMAVYGRNVTPGAGGNFTVTVNVNGGQLAGKDGQGIGQALALEIVKALREFKRHGGGGALGLA